MSRGLVIFAVVVALLVGLPLFYVDSLAKDALEEGATESFGTRTTLGSVNLGLFSGQVGLADLRVRNPEGWEAPHFFVIGSGRFSVGLGDFLEEEVEVDELALDGVSLSLERRAQSSNYATILRNMQSGPPPDPEDPGKRFVIRDLRIRGVTADLRLEGPAGIGRTLQVAIPEIRLRNVGSESQGGVIVSQLWGTVLRAVLAAVVRGGGGPAAFITQDLAGSLSRLGSVPIEMLGEVTRSGAGVAEEGVGRVLEGSGEAAGELLEAGKAAGGAVRRGLGGLLDRKD